MKHFWALPAALRVALASPHSFSVHDDLLAYPQYEIIFSDTFIRDAYASSRLAWASSASSLKASVTNGASSSSDLPSRGEIAKLYDTKDGDHEDTGFDDHALTYEHMLLGNRHYLCSIPSVALESDDNNEKNATTADELQKELVRANDRGWELLQDMQGNCLYYMSGWWSYSFCYNEAVRQFHPLPPSRGVPLFPPVEDPTVPGFELGRYIGDPSKKAGGDGDRLTLEDEDKEKNDGGKGSLETGLARLETKGEVRYLVQKLHGGSICDLTGRDRKIEVQFHCNPNYTERIGLIKEIAICSYLMVIHTPRLCNDVAFLPPQESKANAIACKEILRDDQIDGWKERKTREAEELLVVGEPEDKPVRPIVGGVEVGAKKDVGSEGKVIEKSAVVGGGKETYIDTLASSDGKMMDEKGLKKLNLMTSDELEILKQKLQEMARGKGWKLDLVDTPRGRQLQGVIDNDDEEDEGGKGEEDVGEDEAGEGTEETYKEEL